MSEKGKRAGENPSLPHRKGLVKRGDDPLWVRFAFAAVTGVSSAFAGDPERVVRVSCDLADLMCREADKPL